MTTTLYGDLLAAGVLMDHHESDLYVHDSPTARLLLDKHQDRHPLATRFVDAEGQDWWDVPFAYQPWWLEQIHNETGQARPEELRT